MKTGAECVVWGRKIEPKFLENSLTSTIVNKRPVSKLFYLHEKKTISVAVRGIFSGCTKNKKVAPQSGRYPPFHLPRGYLPLLRH